MTARDEARRVNGLLRCAAGVLAVVLAGTIGYWILGFGLLDATYQTVTTVTTVGFREVRPLSEAGQVFTMVLIVAGVGTVLYAFSVTIEFLVEGQLHTERRRRRMDRSIAKLNGHVVVCGWGRVGRAIAHHLEQTGQSVVVVDQNAERLLGLRHLHVVGDATTDSVLLEAGIERATTLIAAIDTDADNLYVTLSGRSLRSDLFIIARARDESSEAKLRRAGADRVVNPQAIGGARMAAFVSSPNVAEFLDVVMHDDEFEFAMAEILIAGSSPLLGTSFHDPAIRDRTGALILAMRTPGGQFVTGPEPIAASQVLISVGTTAALDRLRALSM